MCGMFSNRLNKITKIEKNLFLFLNIRCPPFDFYFLFIHVLSPFAVLYICTTEIHTYYMAFT